MKSRKSPLASTRCYVLGAHVAEVENCIHFAMNPRATPKTIASALEEALQRLKIVRLELYWESEDPK